ncbi:hypothetical protein HAX54_038024, partial [Datura stramonium]|nr:hypothetical protein [Datura stramonium]
VLDESQGVDQGLGEFLASISCYRLVQLTIARFLIEIVKFEVFMESCNCEVLVTNCEI